MPLNKVHTYDCRLRSSTVWLRPSLLHLYLMLPVYGPHVQKEETFTSHTLSFPASYDCFPTSLDLECAVCAQVGLLFGTPWTVAPQTPLSMRFPGKNTGVGCHFLLQGIFPTQKSSPCLLYWQVGSLPLSYWGSPHREYSLSESYVAPILGHRVSPAIEM